MDTQEAVARSKAEPRAPALSQHPNTAGLNAGTTEAGMSIGMLENYFFSSPGEVSIGVLCNQASQEDRMARETDGISLLRLGIVLLVLAAGAALSGPAPAF